MTQSQREPNIGVECRTPPKRKLRQLPERSLPVFVYLRRSPIFLVGTPRDDLERSIRQWSLRRSRLIPWCSHPDVALLVGRQDHRHGLGIDRFDDGVRQMAESTRFALVPRTPGHSVKGARCGENITRVRTKFARYSPGGAISAICSHRIGRERCC
jgi:hypothetical protein